MSYVKFYYFVLSFWGATKVQPLVYPSYESRGKVYTKCIILLPTSICNLHFTRGLNRTAIKINKFCTDLNDNSSRVHKIGDLIAVLNF